MKLLFENWRKYLKEDVVDIASRQNTGEKEFFFSESQFKQLNSAMAMLADQALNADIFDPLRMLLEPLGVTGDSVYLTTEDPIVNKEETEEPLQMVAEQTEEDDLGLTPYQTAQTDPEVLDLRQKYHGAEGELAARGPKAARDLEKGLGRMSAEEFEEGGYVIRVPEKVLADFKQLVESTQETEGLYEEAKNWYHNIRSMLDQETESDRDATLLGLMIATYSPRAKFALNLEEAVFMYKAIKDDTEENSERLREYIETFPKKEKGQPGEPRGFTGRHKVPNFALNLIAPDLAGKRGDDGETAYDEEYEWNSTIDTWMIDAFYPDMRKASTAKEWEKIKGSLMSNTISYRYMARLVAKVAKKLGLLPHELQALVWVASQVRQTGEAGLGVTTQFAFDQIRQAITNVETFNNNPEMLEKLKEKDWLGSTIYKIDNEGYEAAEQYLLGIRDEKGKFLAKGTRSITSSGKKGTAFGYIKAPEKIEKPKGPMDPKKPKIETEKEMQPHEDPQYSDLKTFYVMNNIIQMPSGKFNDLYDSITLYQNPEFSTEKAVEYITGRFDPEARATKEYFKEGLIRFRVKRR